MFKGSKNIKSGFQTPWKGTANRRPQKLSKPLHNPHAPGAVVLYEPKELKYDLCVTILIALAKFMLWLILCLLGRNLHVIHFNALETSDRIK